ncbi:exported hypothetical protein [Cupriavidus taiwanensis]|nr:exported hypothetical protein [Cupriavidus taiwanensis]
MLVAAAPAPAMVPPVPMMTMLALRASAGAVAAAAAGWAAGASWACAAPVIRLADSRAAASVVTRAEYFMVLLGIYTNVWPVLEAARHTLWVEWCRPCSVGGCRRPGLWCRAPAQAAAETIREEKFAVEGRRKGYADSA